MTDDRDPTPESERRQWERAFSHPDVERVDLIDGIVRVRLRSGIELEWPMQSIEPPAPRDWDPS